jgi:hypothetical protein
MVAVTVISDSGRLVEGVESVDEGGFDREYPMVVNNVERRCG